MVNWADCVSSVGLVLDIVGVSLLFKYGLSPELRESGGSVLVWGGGMSSEEAKEYRRYKRMSRIALGLLVVGFVLQIVGNFLS